MGILDFLKKGTASESEPLGELTLDNMKPGDLVDYDLKTWEVKACHAYDWGDGDMSYEWQLISPDAVAYLQKESDDEDDWSLNRSIHFNRLGPDIKDTIVNSGDPPNEIVYEGDTYFLTETAGGHYLKDRKTPGKEMLSWSYEDDTGSKYLTIEQWGEDDFQASVGIAVESYQFTNILPGNR